MPWRKAAPHRIKVTHYCLPDGTRCQKGTKGAKKKIVRTETFYATLGGRRISLKTTDIGTAWTRLRELQKEEADRQAGIRTTSTDVLSRPLPDLVAQWCETVRAKGTSADQCKRLLGRMTRLIDAAGWKRWADVSKDGLIRGLAVLRDGGLSRQTSNHYRTHALGWSAWLSDLAGVRDPLHRASGRMNVEVDRRHPRRCPSDDDLRLLFDYLDSGCAPIRCGMTGIQRALGYRVCMATGFRAGELNTLTRESFDLARGTVVVLAEYDKRGRMDTMHLPAWLVEQLAEWFTADGGTWQGFHPDDPGRLLRLDLQAAGVPYRTEEGFFDFHALRHWFVTQAANQPGISPKTLMSVCRHSTAQLSLGVYAKARLADQRAVADQIPDPTPRPRQQRSAERRA